MRLPNTRFDPGVIEEIRRLIEIEDRGVRETARLLNVSRGTVWRVVMARRDTGEFRRLAKPRHCPRHGLVTIWPCVACAAEEVLTSGTHPPCRLAYSGNRVS